jgi:hypothetical protein
MALPVQMSAASRAESASSPWGSAYASIASNTGLAGRLVSELIFDPRPNLCIDLRWQNKRKYRRSLAFTELVQGPEPGQGKLFPIVWDFKTFFINS